MTLKKNESLTQQEKGKKQTNPICYHWRWVLNQLFTLKISTEKKKKSIIYLAFLVGTIIQIIQRAPVNEVNPLHRTMPRLQM